jgi:tetratricopeptide (TPR) repeat protein
VAGIIAVLAGALIVALIQRERAETVRREAISQRERAEKARDDAEGLIKFMVFDLQDKLRPMGQLGLLDSVTQRVNNYYQSMAAENPSPEILRRQSAALDNYGDVIFAQGRYDDALADFTAGKDIAEKRIAKYPNDTEWQHILANALWREANIAFVQGQKSDAAEAMDRAANIYARLAETLNMPEARTESSKAWGALSRYLLFANQPEKAVGASRKGLETDPSEVWINTNLAHGHLFCGKYAQAEKIYLDHWTAVLDDGRRFDQAVMDDFKELRHSGIMHPDMERIEKQLTSRR